MDRLSEAKNVFDIEINALEKLKQSLDETFIRILEMITSCKGKVILTGIGKPGHIAKKLASTFSSLGTPAFYLHPAEALHGDLGMINDKDVLIAISFSGESEEITRILPNVKMIGAQIIAISGNANSTLVKQSDIAQIFPVFKEACYLGLAPTSSTAAALVYGDALAVVASRVYGFTDRDFGKYHPAGSLGKKLILKIDDIMVHNDENPVIESGSPLIDAIAEMSKKGLGVVSVVDRERRLMGVLTDGDLRRIIERRADVYRVNVDETMTKTPIYVVEGEMAVNVLKMIKMHSINCLPVLDDDLRVKGTVTLQMIVKAGIIY